MFVCFTDRSQPVQPFSEESRRKLEMPSSLHLRRIIPSDQSLASNCFKQSQTTTITPPIITLTFSMPVPDSVARHHTHEVGPNQGCSAVIQTINAPIPIVWSVVRRFDNPQAYKHFLRSCHVIDGDGDVGTLREVRVVSGLPAESSTERLEILDDEKHVLSFSIIGGDHRLANYRSVTTLHPTATGKGTVVVESYVVDAPQGNTEDETCVFADTIVRCNLQSLSKIAENMAKKSRC